MNRLKELRIKQGLTIRELGKKTNLSHSMISRLENGVCDFTEQNLKNLANFFGVSVDYLLGLSNDEKGFSSEDDFTFALYDKVKDLTEEQKQDLMKIIEILKKQK